MSRARAFWDLPAGVLRPTGQDGGSQVHTVPLPLSPGTRRGDSPAGTLSPSFCQVMLGRGRPEASQGSRTSSATTTRTTLGSGFTTGAAAEEQAAEVPGDPVTPGFLCTGGL